MPPLIELKQLQFSYGQTAILRDVSLNLAQGDLLAIIGPSGCGKTTLFKLIAGLLEPHSGRIRVGDRHGIDRRSLVSYMMQEDMLLPWRTVEDNVALAAELSGSRICRSTISELLSDLGMAHSARLLPQDLSGGMRQRVSLARALLHDRPILLLDEPFQALDVARREEMYALVREVHSKHNKTTLLVTHDFRDALQLADRIILIGGGRVQEEWILPSDVRHCPESLGVWQERLRVAVRRELHKTC